MGKPLQWNEAHIPSQVGRIAIVTGTNSGIGYVAALCLAKRGAHVILACRNEGRGRKAEQDMRTSLDEHSTDEIGSVQLMLMDLSSLASVLNFATEFRQRFNRLDLLINNAGVAVPPEMHTLDGFETHFGVNHLGHFYLTALLFDLLKASQASRVVNVGSLWG